MRLAAVSLLLALALPAPVALLAVQEPTPQVTQLQPVVGDDRRGYLLRAPTPGGGRGFIGVYVVCGLFDERLTVAASFGLFPEDGRPVQLAVRSATGAIDRFGPVVRHSGSESGFHSPLLEDPEDVERFVAVAFRSGALISNGYRSIWNRVDEAQNAQARFLVDDC